MKRAWFKFKEIWWKIILVVIITLTFLAYFYRLLLPSQDRLKYLEAIKTEATVALKVNELRGRLEKDKIGAVRDVFNSRLEDVKNIDDREERLKSLIRLHQELDI